MAEPKIPTLIPDLPTDFPLTRAERDFLAFDDPVMREAVLGRSRQFGSSLPSVSGEPREELGVLEGLGRSFVHGLGPSLVGVDPSPELADFMNENPISSFVAEMTGSFLPYSVPFLGQGALGLRLASKLPAVGRLVTASEKATLAGKAGRAAFYREVARFAPLEGSRVAVATLLGSGPEVAQQATFNLALAGAFGGAFGRLSRQLPAQGPEFKPEGRISEFLPEYDLLGSPQTRRAQLLDAQKNRNPEATFTEIEADINSILPRLAHEIVDEDFAPRIVSRLESEEGEKTARAISEIFKGKRGSKIQRLMVGKGEELLDSAEELAEVMRKAGISEETLHHVQFPRVATTESKAGRERLLTALGGLDQVEPGAWLGRENNGGLFVVAKRVKSRGKFETQPATFETALGSKYTLHPDGTTTRIKAARPGHTDFGLMPRSTATYFVDDTGVRALTEVQASGTKRNIQVLDSNTIGVQYTAGGTPGKFELRTVTTFSKTPKVGYTPVEQFADGSVHFGNKITKETKARRSTASKPEAGDRYILFKTDRPDKFLRNASRPSEELQRVFGPLGRQVDLVSATGPLSNFYNSLARSYPQGAGFEGVGKTQLSELFGRTFARISPALEEIGENTGRNIQNLVGKQIQQASAFFAPIINRFSENKFALRIAMVSRSMFAHATKLAEQEFSGKHDFGTSVLRDIAKGDTSAKGSIRNLLWQVFNAEGDKVTRARQINQAIADNIDGKEAIARGYDPLVRQLVDKLNAIDSRKIDELIQTQLATDGEASFKPLANHLMVSRQWRGNHRVAVFEEGNPNAIVGYGSGHSIKDALREADALIADVNKGEGTKVARRQGSDAVFNTKGSKEHDYELLGTLRSSETASRFNAAKAYAVREPQRFAERHGMRGYNASLTEDELARSIRSNLLETNKYIAKRLIRHGLAKDFDMVAKTGRNALTSELNRTIAAFRGKRQFTEVRTDQFGKVISTEVSPTHAFAAVEEAIDKVLEPTIGYSASQITQAINEGIYHLTLGAGDMGFAALNSITPVTNLTPEIAFIVGTPPEKLAQLGRWYSVAPVMTRNGMRPIRTLEAPRIVAEAYKNIGANKPETFDFYQRLVKRGDIGRGLLDEVIGPAAPLKMQLKEAISGKRGFGQFLRTLSTFAGDKSEKFSRAVTAEAARLTGSELWGLEGKALEQFASEVIGRTMFGYTAADRPRVLTGAVGGFFGLFKNWTAHYIANMLTYAGAGVREGNWGGLVWMFGGLGAVGGIGAMPGVGMADAASKFLSDKPLQQQLNTAFGLTDEQLPLTDVAWYGLPALAHVTFQGRASAPGAHFVRDLNMMLSSVTLDRAMFLGKAIGETLSDPLLSINNHPIKSREVRDLWARALAPRFLYRFLQTTGNQQLRSLSTGNALMDNVSLPKSVAFSLGVTPLDVEKHFAAQTVLWEDQNETRELVGSYGEALALAWQRGDLKDSRDLWRSAFERGIPLGSVARSMQSRERNFEEPLIERQFDALKKDRVKKAFGVAD